MSYNELNIVRGYALAKEMKNTLLALNIAEQAHSTQTRKGSGEPYFYHPLAVAQYCIDAGADRDEIVATALLHDILEDTETTVSDLKARGIDDVVIEAVELVTKKRNFDKLKDDKEYYDKISQNEIASIVKVADRCHNLSTMGVCWDADRILSYIKETEDYTIPLLKNARWRYPQYLKTFHILEKIIDAVIGNFKPFLLMIVSNIYDNKKFLINTIKV